MKQTYTWHLYPRTGGNVDQLLKPVKSHAGFILTRNKWVVDAEIEIYDDFLAFKMTMKGHDRWWIRRRAPYLISSIMVRCDLPSENVIHKEIATPPSLKNARFWSTGEWNQGERILTPADGSEPDEPKKRKCKTCQEDRERQRYWHGGTGWHSGDEIKHIDLRKRAF